MKSQNRKNTHGFFSNLEFMVREQWRFEKKGVIIPLIRIPSQILVSLLGIWTVKVVLDSIERQVNAEEFIIRIGLLTLALMLLMFVNYYSEQTININTVKIWNLHFYINKVWKIVDMDYSNFSSAEGKTKIINGHLACNRNINVNMTSFYPHFVEVIISIFGLITFSSVLATLNPIIILLLIAAYAVNGLTVLFIENKEHKSKEERAKIDRKFDYVVHETSNSNLAKDIRAYNMTDWINKKAGQFLQEKLGWQKKLQTMRFLQSMIASLISFLQNGGAYAYLIWKIVSNEITIGDFAFYFGIISGFANWLGAIVSRIGNLSNANHKVDDYRDLVEIKDKMNRDQGAPVPALDQPVEISLQNVSFKYEGNDELILDNININISKEEKLAIVGPNGAGKTTLVKLICGLLQPVSGRILMNGVDINDFNRDEYYTVISAVFQNICLLPVSIARNITFSAEDEIEWDKLYMCVDQANIKDKIESLPDTYGTSLVPSVTGSGIDLSGGEKQKLLLARALYKNAPLLILDEPTAALDPIAEHNMYLKYDEMANNKISIYISHRLSSTRFCDRIVYIDNKRIIESGTHDELIVLGGEYSKIYDIQSRYYKMGAEEIIS